MILKQLAMLLATNFLKQTLNQKVSQSSWIADSTNAITYTAVTSMFLNKLSVLLKKSLVVIPLTIFGSVLAVFCYLDLMNLLDNRATGLPPSFVVNCIGFAVCFTVAFVALNHSASSSLKTSVVDEISNSSHSIEENLSGSNLVSVNEKAPIHNVTTQVQENISFFKRGFVQGFEKTP